jgi:pSer/pThr/pTyr-binding forkhead associated (FHA) protein
VALRLQVTALDDPQARVFAYEFDDDRAEITLGRRGGVDVLLPHPRVALVQARVERRGRDYFLVALDEEGGLRLNGADAPVGQRVPLRDGDRLSVAEFALLVGLTGKRAEWPAESSGSLARHMARDLLERLGPGGSQPHLTVADGPAAGVVLTLGEVGRTYMLGRASGEDVRLDDVDLFREHAALVRDEEGVIVRDLGASPQLQVNGQRVDGARRLVDGDVISFGATTLRYFDPADRYLKELEEPPPAEEPQPGAASRSGVRPAPPVARPRMPVERLLLLIAGCAALVAGVLVAWVLLW